MTVKTRIRERLEALGLSMRRASELSGMGETAIRDLLKNDTQSPRLDTLRKIAPVLKTSVEWLVNGEGEPEQDELLSQVIDFWGSKLDRRQRQEVFDFVRFKSRANDKDN